MKYQPLAAIIAALALYGCAPLPAPTPAVCPVPAAPPAAAIIHPAPPILPPALPLVPHHAATHPTTHHHPAYRYYALRTNRTTVGTPGCGTSDHPCNVEHATAPVQ